MSLCVHRNMNVIVPPHPTGHWSWMSSACVCWTARKMIRLLCLCAHKNMNVITPPHPTPPVTDHERAVPVSAGQQERWWGCCACVCTGTWTLLPHPTPTHPTGNWSWMSGACVCWTTRKVIRLLCLCVHRNMNIITPPHPTPTQPTGNWSWKRSACVCWTARKMMRLLRLCVHKNMNIITPPHPIPPHPTPLEHEWEMIRAGVALFDIDLHVVWQAWHFLTSTLMLRGRRGTFGHRPSCTW